MANLDELLSQLAKRPSGAGYGQEVAQTNAFEQAPLLAQAITRYQKEQRAQPYAADLQGLSSQFAKAPVAQQPQVNARANALRQAYIRSGGSPIDLPKELWGSDPNQGFQTGLGQFTPGYAGDNLSIGQKLNIAPVTGMYEGKPTWERQYQESGLTGFFQGKPTVAKTTADASITNAKNDNAFNREKFLYDQDMDMFKFGSGQQKDAAKQLQDAKDTAFKYFDSIKVGQYSSNPLTAASQKKGIEKLDQVDLSPKLKGELKADFGAELDNFLTQDNPVEYLNSDKAKKYLVDKYGTFKANHLYNSIQSALGTYGPK